MRISFKRSVLAIILSVAISGLPTAPAFAYLTPSQEDLLSDLRKVLTPEAPKKISKKKTAKKKPKNNQKNKIARREKTDARTSDELDRKPIGYDAEITPADDTEVIAGDLVGPKPIQEANDWIATDWLKFVNEALNFNISDEAASEETRIPTATSAALPPIKKDEKAAAEEPITSSWETPSAFAVSDERIKEIYGKKNEEWELTSTRSVSTYTGMDTTNAVLRSQPSVDTTSTPMLTSNTTPTTTVPAATPIAPIQDVKPVEISEKEFRRAEKLIKSPTIEPDRKDEIIEDLMKKYKDALNSRKEVAPIDIGLQPTKREPFTYEKQKKLTTDSKKLAIESMTRLINDEDFRKQSPDVVYSKIIHDIIDPKIKENILSKDPDPKLHSRLIKSLTYVPNRRIRKSAATEKNDEKANEKNEEKDEAITIIHDEPPVEERYKEYIELNQKRLLKGIVKMTIDTNSILDQFSKNPDATIEKLDIKQLEDMRDMLKRVFEKLAEMREITEEELLKRISFNKKNKISHEDRILALQVLAAKVKSGDIELSPKEYAQVMKIVSWYEKQLQLKGKTIVESPGCQHLSLLAKDKKTLLTLFSHTAAIFNDKAPKQAGFVTAYKDSLMDLKAKFKNIRTALEKKKGPNAEKAKKVAKECEECVDGLMGVDGGSTPEPDDAIDLEDSDSDQISKKIK